LATPSTNALAESFVDSFKTELIADRVWCSGSQLELSVIEYIASLWCQRSLVGSC
jgi:hypothetical protein